MSSSAKSSRPNRRKASALSNPAQSTAANSNSLNSDGLGTSLLSSPQSKRKRKSTSSCNSSTPAAEPLDQPSASSSSQPTTTRSSKAIKRRNSAGSEQQVKAKVRKSTSKKSVTVATSSPEASRSGDLAGVSTATTDQASLDSIDLSEGSSSSLRTTRSSKSKTASKSAAVTSPASHSAKTSRKSFRKTKASTGSSTDRKPSGLAPPADQPTSSTDGARRKISQLSDHFPDLKTVGLRRFTRSLVKRLSHTSTPDLSTGEADKDTGSKDTNIFDSVTSASTEATTGNCNSSSCLNSGTRTSSVFPEGTASSTAMASSGGANNNGSADQSQDQIEMGRLQALLESRGISGHFFSALGPRMHGLLQRNNNHSINGKTQSLITGMQNTGDESSQLQSVMEMCQLLLMGNEETLGSNFPIKQVTPTLITLLQMEHNFDIMTNACRALTYMMEALPRSSSVVCTAIPTFLDKLKRIECMDVAEQALTALEMLSRRHSKSIVTAGGVATCLLYVDFFSIVAQRSAMNIAANCCYHLNPEEFNLIGDSIEALTLRIMSQDKKSVESTCLCFTRLVDNFQNDIAKLKEVAGRGLLEKTLQVLVLSPPVLSTNTFISVIRMLHLLCHTCPELAVQLLQLNVTDTLRFLLLGTTDAKCDIELVARTPQELHEIVCLIGELMPRLPTDGIFTVNKLLSKQNAAALASLNDVVWQWQDEGGMWRPYTTIDCRILETAFQNKDDEGTINALGRTYTVDFNRMRQTNDDTGNSRPVHRRLMTSAARGIPANMAELKLEEDDRLQLIRSNPKLAESFVRALFPVLYEVYNTSAGPSVRHECLAALCRIICHSDETVLREILSNLAISSHIANMLNSQDLKIQVGAVQLVCVLLDKLPDVFSVFFRREGVMHQIERLADAPLIRHASSTPALNLTTSVVSQQQQHGGPSALLSRAPHTAPIFGAPSFLAPPPTNATIPPLTSSNIFTNGFSTSFNHPSNIQRDTGGLTAGGILPSTGPSINLTQFFMPAAAHPVPHYASSTAMPARVVMPPISAGAIASPSGGPPSSFTVAPPPLGPPASFNPNAPVFGDSSYLGLLNSFAQSQPQHVGVLQQAALQELHNQAAAAAAAGFLLPAPTDAPNTVAPPASDLSSLTVPDNNNRNPPASLASSLAQWATVFPPSPLVFPPPDSNTTSNAEGLGAPPTWMLGGSPISATTSTQYPGSPFTDAALQLPRSVVPILEPPQHPPRRNSASTVVSDRRKSATSSRDGGANRPPPSTGAAVDKAVKRHERHQQRHERRERQLNISDMAPAASTSPRSPQAPVTRSRAQAAKERSSKSESEGASKSQRKSNEESRTCLYYRIPRTTKYEMHHYSQRGHATSANISAAGGTVKSPTSFGAMFSSLPFARWAQRGIASSQSSKTGSSSAKNSLVSASATLNTDAASMRSSDSRNSRQYNPYQHFTTTMPTFMDRNGTQSSSYMANLAVGSQLNQNRDKIREWVKDQAQELRTKYFTNTDDSSSSDQHHVTSLSVLSKLTKTTELLKNKENFDPMPLHQLKTIIVDSDVSSFEIMHSGLVNALLHYLTDGSDSLTPRESTGDGSSYSMSKSNARKSTAVAQKSPVEVRLKHFCAIFLNLTESTENDVIRLDVDNAPALSLLVSKLNSCLTLIEQFPVKVHDLPGGPQGCLRGVSALKFFHTHQIKCNLKRHPDCHSLKQWKKGAVKIDPLALVSAVERYMLQKGYGRLREDDDDDMTDDDASDEDLEDALNTLASHSSGQHKLQFLVNDHPLPYNVTIYQAIRQYGMGLLSGGGGENSHGASSPSETDNEGEMGVVSYASIWVNTHTLTYRPIPENQSKNETGCGPGSTAHSNKKQQPHQDAAASTTKNGGPKSPKHLKSESLAWTEGHIPGLRNPLVPFLTTQLSAGLNSNDASVECLALLRVLHALNRFWWTLFMKTHTVPSFSPVVPGVEFVNTKLAAKANRQLQDPLVIMTGNLPSWLRQIAYACPFVFPFETRQLLFYVVAFDRDRALQRLLDTCPDLLGPQEGSERITPRLERKKTTIQRDDLLKQAEQVMNDASNSLAVLEVQYKDEVGTGLGPTLEFFALVSQEFQKVDLELWRSEKLLNVTDAESLSEYVFAGQGLYPSALGHQPKPSLLGKVRGKFKFFGKFMARALMDSRMIDVPLSSVFYKWLLREESFLSRADLVHLDSTLGSSISQLNEFVIRKQKLSLPGDEMTLVALSQEIVDLDLDFTLPGYASLELLKGGKHKPVTIENLEHYLALISHNLLVIGVQRQMEAFREGFESVFPLTNLKMFYSDELDQVFCGSASGSGTSGWDSQVILQYIKPDHGYNHNSPQIKWLAQMLQQFDAEQQRGFLQFLTGCPKLPVGGFKNLSPTLTVVRKGVDAGEDPDHYLPSVMTCVNYLKLPEYGSLETMTDRMLIAIREGQRSFHLS